MNTPRQSADPRSRPQASLAFPVLVEKLDVAGQWVLLGVLALVPLVYTPVHTDYMVPKTALVELAAPLLLGMLLVRAALAGWPAAERLRSVGWPMAGLTVITVGAWVGSEGGVLGGEAVLVQLGTMGLCLAGAWAAAQPGFLSRAFTTITGVSGVVSLVGILQYLGLHLIPAPRHFGDSPISTLGNPNFVAHYLAITIPLQVGLLLCSKQWRVRLLVGGVLAVSCVHLALVRSLGGGLAWATGTLVMTGGILWSTGPRARKMIAVMLAALATAALVVVILAYRAPGGGDAGGRGVVVRWIVDRAHAGRLDNPLRVLIWQDALDIIHAHPWLGVGPGQFAIQAPAYRPVDRQRQWRAVMGTRNEIANHAHDEYLEQAVETGIPGLAALLWLVLAIACGGVRTTLAGGLRENTQILNLSCLAAMAATLAYSLVSFNLHDPPAAVYFWTTAGFLVTGGAAARVAPGLEGGAASGQTRPGTRVADRDDAPPAWRVTVAVGIAVVLFGMGVWAASALLVGDYFYFAGRRADRMGRLEEAAEALRRAVRWRPYDFRYHHMLGVIAWKRGLREQALREVKLALRIDPHEISALELAGRAYGATGKTDSAVAVLQRAVCLDGTRHRTLVLLALAQRRAGQHRLAVETWRRALALRPGDPGMLNSLGVEYAQAGDVRKAVAVLEAALKAHPEQMEIKGNLGSLYLTTGRTEKGIHLLREALQARPRQTTWRLRLATYYVKAGDRAAAGGQIRAILSYDEGNPAALRLARAIHLNVERNR